MSVARCGWRGCTQPPRLVLLVGDVPEAAEARGAYCMRHASVKRRAIERQAAAPVWLDWAEPAPPSGRQLVGEGPRERTLHRHLPERQGTRP